VTNEFTQYPVTSLGLQGHPLFYWTNLACEEQLYQAFGQFGIEQAQPHVLDLKQASHVQTKDNWVPGPFC
jgi:hypothetical protein